LVYSGVRVKKKSFENAVALKTEQKLAKHYLKGGNMKESDNTTKYFCYSMTSIVTIFFLIVLIGDSDVVGTARLLIVFGCCVILWVYSLLRN